MSDTPSLLEQIASPEIVGFLAALLIISFAAISCCSMRHFSDTMVPNPVYNYIPYVGIWPFLGADPYRTIMEMAGYYGPVFRLKMGSQDMVVVNSYGAINEVLKTKARSFDGKPSSDTVSDTCGFAHREGGTDWHTRRVKLAIPAMNMIGNEVFHTILNDECQSLIAKWKCCSMEPFNPRRDLTEHCVRIMYRCCFKGKTQCDTTDDMDYIIDHLDDYSKNTGLLSEFNCFPFLTVFKSGTYQKFKSINTGIKSLTQPLLTTHLHNKESTMMDLTNAYIHIMEKSFPGQMPTTTLLSGIEDIVRSGSEAPSIGLAWCVMYLAAHPSLQERIFREVSDNFNEDETLDYPSYRKLPFTSSLLHEILRHAFITPFGKRMCTNDVFICGKLVKKGTAVATNLWSTSRDKGFFPDPELFNPERFLSDDGSFNDLLKGKYLAFGTGPRRCFGEAWACRILFLSMIQLVRNFKIQEVGIEPQNFQPIFGMSLVPKPFKVALLIRG